MTERERMLQRAREQRLDAAAMHRRAESLTAAADAIEAEWGVKPTQQGPFTAGP